MYFFAVTNYLSCSANKLAISICSMLSFVAIAVAPRINGSEAVDRRSVVIGGSLTLDCPATGEPQPDIQWSRHGETLSLITEPNLRTVDGGRELQLLGSHLHDAGSYTCTATNPAGSANKQFAVNVIGNFIRHAETNFLKFLFCGNLCLSIMTLSLLSNFSRSSCSKTIK